MTEFNLGALEQALSKKGRQPHQDLSISEGKSKQELYNEANKLAKEYYDIFSQKLITRYRGISYHIQYGALRIGYKKAEDIDMVPIQVFERLVVNGRHHLKDFHEMVSTVALQNPEIALEANLEGKTNTDVLKYIYNKRISQLTNLLIQRIKSPKVRAEFEFVIDIKLPLEREFQVSIGWGSLGRLATVTGVAIYPRNGKEMTKLVHFLTYFKQVTDEVNRQLDTIIIRKG